MIFTEDTNHSVVVVWSPATTCASCCGC